MRPVLLPARGPAAWAASVALSLASMVLAGCATPRGDAGAPIVTPAPTIPANAASAPPSAPEAASGFRPGIDVATATRHMAAAANPLATEAGRDILRAGGSAVDAAIAMQMVLTLVEPQSSGIGGGAFMLHWDGRRVQAFDGRETAPSAADEQLFVNDKGRAMGFVEAVVGGRSVGTPGVLRMLEMAHRQHGRLPWARLFEPAIRLAEQGFPMSPRLFTLLAGEKELARNDIAARE
jgi:gamma-glutamyltranspeptidase/glutathione hydrolase